MNEGEKKGKFKQLKKNWRGFSMFYESLLFLLAVHDIFLILISLDITLIPLNEAESFFSNNINMLLA